MQSYVARFSRSIISDIAALLPSEGVWETKESCILDIPTYLKGGVSKLAFRHTPFVFSIQKIICSERL